MIRSVDQSNALSGFEEANLIGDWQWHYPEAGWEGTITFSRGTTGIAFAGVVYKADVKTKKVTVFAHEPTMNQPNDLAIAPDGTLYASDPDWNKGTGQVWMISTKGKVKRVAEKMGTTNGIEVSPDGKTLYVNESVQRNVWAFRIQPDGSLSGKRLLKKFPDHGFDGMRCDVDGNLYVTRHGKGTVVVLLIIINVGTWAALVRAAMLFLPRRAEA